MKQELFFQFIKSNSLGPGAKQIWEVLQFTG
jgi:hypothetical protein